MKEKTIFSFKESKIKYATFTIEGINGNTVTLTTEEMASLNIKKNPIQCLEFKNGLPEAVKCLVSDLNYSLY